jgi:hypothetical protein
MISKELMKTVDRTFRIITKVDVPFGGDFHQVLPVSPKAS